MYGRMDSNFARFWPTPNEKEVERIMKREAHRQPIPAWCGKLVRGAREAHRQIALARFRRLLKGGR